MIYLFLPTARLLCLSHIDHWSGRSRGSSSHRLDIHLSAGQATRSVALSVLHGFARRVVSFGFQSGRSTAGRSAAGNGPRIDENRLRVFGWCAGRFAGHQCVRSGGVSGGRQRWSVCAVGRSFGERYAELQSNEVRHYSVSGDFCIR